MQFIARLKQSLATLPLSGDTTTQIVNEDALQCIIVIVSSSFEGVDEAERQRTVWQHLLKTFTLDEMRGIEFIFTDAPSERALAT